MPRRTVLRSGAQAEASFGEQFAQAARLLHWAAYHTFDSRRSREGFPDWVLVRGNRLLFVELKSDEGTLSTAQAAWLAALERVRGVEVWVWRPADWPRIRAILA